MHPDEYLGTSALRGPSYQAVLPPTHPGEQARYRQSDREDGPGLPKHGLRSVVVLVRHRCVSGQGGLRSMARPKARPSIQDGPPCTAVRLNSKCDPLCHRTRLFGNDQHLARVDVVGILQHRLIGFEDLPVRIGVAVVLFGDCGEGVSALDLMHLRLPCLRCDAAKTAVVNGVYVFDVANNHRQLLPRCLVGHITGHLDPRAFHINVDVAWKSQALDFFPGCSHRVVACDFVLSKLQETCGIVIENVPFLLP